MGSKAGKTDEITQLRNVLYVQSQAFQTNTEIINKLFKGLAIGNEGNINTSIHEL